MKISIITAIYNSKEHIESVINSVTSQSYKDIEYIIIDGGSTDGTVQIIKNLELRIQYEIQKFIFISQPDDGIYDALNKGIQLASGDVIGFLHADDIFFDEFVIENIANVFKAKNVDSVYSDLVYVYKDNPDKVLRYWRAGEFNHSLLKQGWMPPHTTFFVKKKIYDEFGGFNTSYKIAGDYDLILRFLSKHKISNAYLPEITVKMRAGGKSNRSLGNILQKSLEDYKAIKYNKISFPLYTLIMKNLSKLPQFFYYRPDPQ